MGYRDKMTETKITVVWMTYSVLLGRLFFYRFILKLSRLELFSNLMNRCYLQEK